MLQYKHMIRRQEIAASLPPDFVHVVTGEWATKTIHIDGELVTVAMLYDRVLEEEEALTDDDNDYHGAWGLDVNERVDVFDWGRSSVGAHLLSLAWIFWFGAQDVHDFVFGPLIKALPRTDFTYEYPRTRLDQDFKRGGKLFASDFQRGMKEMGAIERDPRWFPEVPD